MFKSSGRSNGRNTVRSALIAGASALVLVSCGGSSGESSGPPVLSVYGDQPETRLSQMDASAGDQLTMLAQMRFDLGAELPPLDGVAPAYTIANVEPDQGKVDTLLSIFGVEGELVEQTAQAGGGYFAGSTDGSGPALYVGGDALRFWNYSPPWSDSTTNPACLDTEGIEPVAPPTPVTDTVVVADTEAPEEDAGVTQEEDQCPEDGDPVPTEDEALQMFSDLMSDIGIDVDSLDIEVYSDSYGSSVSGFLRIDGVRSSLSWSVSYGEGSRITWAGGVLADTTELAEYERIGTTAALDRLNEQQSALVDQMSDGELAASSGTGDELVVRIVEVEEELVTFYGVDGSVYLLPGYAFLADPDEFGYRPRYTVSAVPDEFLEVVAPPAVSEDPSVVDPGTGVVEPGDDLQSGGTTGGEMEQEITSEQANTLLGMSEAEATSTAEANGWVVRIASRDGEQFALTMDYNWQRVNLTIDGGVVTDVFIG